MDRWSDGQTEQPKVKDAELMYEAVFQFS